jgi:multisubunit Na+/H+ antiporter MnhE subunit
MLERAGWWIVEWAVLCLVWFLFVDTVRWTEAVSGVAAAALAAAATEPVRGEEHPRFFPYFRWVLMFWRMPREILRDHWLLLRHLFRIFTERNAPAGAFQEFPFEARGNDPRSIARRTLAIVYSTLPPNTIVIGIDRKRNTLMQHQLEPCPLSEPVRALEAKR